MGNPSYKRRYPKKVTTIAGNRAQSLKGFFFPFWLVIWSLSQLVTQEDYLGLQVLRITHHCYGLALNTSRSPQKEASAWKSCFTPRNAGPAGISPAKLHIIVGAASRYRTPGASAKVRLMGCSLHFHDVNSLALKSLNPRFLP
jgi:hypothetical protein